MRAGELRHRIILEENVPTRNATREEIPNWQVFTSVWGDVKPVSAREFISNERASAEVSHKIKLRYLPGLKPSMRVRWGARLFEIEGILDQGGRQRELVIMARETVAESAV